MRILPTAIDVDALKALGIAEGEFVALVFSGPIDMLGESLGMMAWSTPRKFVIDDPRSLESGAPTGNADAPLPKWTGVVAPVPGVCFVLSDRDHPLRRVLARAGAEEFEHFVTIDTLTTERVREHQLRHFLARAANRRIALLGFGDQGSKLLTTLESLGVCASDVLVIDGDAQKREAARSRGAAVSASGDLDVGDRSIISSPLHRPRAFDAICDQSRRDERAVLDNSRDFAGQSEFVLRGQAELTRGADRVLRVEGLHMQLREHAPAVTLGVVRQETRRLGSRAVPHVHGVQRVDLAPGGGVDLSLPPTSETHPASLERTERVFVGIDGQSNQHDAALGMMAARTVLLERSPEAVRTILPTERRVHLGRTPFESHLSASITGRVLGPARLTPIEQTTLGVLARLHAHDAPMIEIGSALGGSAMIMGLATMRHEPGDGPAIVSIDSDPETRPAMRLVLRHAGLETRVRMLQRTSDDATAEAADIVEPLGGAGLIFIDGLHTFEQCARDYVNYLPLLRPGGVMIFHDVNARFAGVVRAVLEGPMRHPELICTAIMDTMAVFVRSGRDPLATRGPLNPR
ncbi:MAG: class I SAM-dependent methyltransferase [Phycisphaerales bacterium]|nr:class I SAM-dependent methyltransferase [Phycisphaerales bacterium]